MSRPGAPLAEPTGAIARRAKKSVDFLGFFSDFARDLKVRGVKIDNKKVIDNS
jgi:hypothetical protein